LTLIDRYAIDTASADWSVAETQLANAGGVGRSTVVSVKSGPMAGQKRKVDELEKVQKEKKQTRRGKKPRR